MSRQQVLSLVLGVLFLACGIFVLGRMTQVQDTNSLGELFVAQPAATPSPEKTTEASLPSGTQTQQDVADNAATALPKTAKTQTDEASGFTKMLQKIVDLNIPIWVYFVIFIAVVLGLRSYSAYKIVKSKKNS